MKHLLTITMLLHFLLMANYMQAQSNSTNNNSGKLNLKGAYLMTRQVANDGTKDSVMNNQQLKIFTDRHMIYVHPIDGDSLASYGIGNYRIENGKVIEDVFYTASGGAEKNSFELNISKSENGFSQSSIIPEYRGRRWTLEEDYTNVSRNVTTPLDGAWKQAKVTHIAPDGTSSTNASPTQFKVFESGHFIWVHTALDSATQKPVSQYGYGTFEMQGNNKAIEVNSSSTFKTMLVGKPMTVQLAFTGKNAYRQTIVFDDGSKIIEEYKRLQ